MPNLAEEHLELEKIFWSAYVEQDPNEWVELSLRMCGVLCQKLKRDIGDHENCVSGYITFPEASEHWAAF